MAQRDGRDGRKGREKRKLSEERWNGMGMLCPLNF